MKFTATGSGLDACLDDVEQSIAKKATVAMWHVTEGVKEDLRQQMLNSGLSQRLANTWRGKVYPEYGRSLDPAAFVFSKAPNIILSMAESITIRPVNGSKYLAIPTKDTPNRRGRRGGAVPMTPVEVEALYNQDLIILRGKKGHWLAFVNVIPARNRRGFRKVTPGRLDQGRAVQLKLMFVLVPYVRTRKRLDLDATAKRWSEEIPKLLDQAVA